jgi:hypothetical protein
MRWQRLLADGGVEGGRLKVTVAGVACIVFFSEMNSSLVLARAEGTRRDVSSKDLPTYIGISTSRLGKENCPNLKYPSIIKITAMAL